MSYSIRAASPADVEPMLALFPRLAAFPLPPERRAEHLWEGDADLLRRWTTGVVPQCLVYVAVDPDDRIVGVVMAQLREELLSHQPSAHLEVVAVHADAEGQGIGRRLIEEIEQKVQARGAESLTLHVFGTNTRARSVYERLGFTGELIRYIKYFGQAAKPDPADRSGRS